MCTVTLHRSPGRLLVFMNRDERRSRPEHGLRTGRDTTTGHVQGWYPVDGQSGGTWMGLASAGHVLCLLNRHYATPGEERNGRVSRGRLILEALQCTSTEACLTHLLAQDLSVHDPFELLLSDLDEQHRLVWNGEDLRHARIPWSKDTDWSVISSSSWQEDTVVSRRIEQFHAMVDERQDPVDVLLDYHHHRFKHDAESSVLMSRKESCTRSLTRVEVTPTQRIMSWQPMDHLALPPDHTRQDR